MPDKLLADGAAGNRKRELAAMIRRQPVEGTAAALGAMAERPDARPWLPGIDRPCLVLAGAQDELIPPEASRTMAAAITDSQLVLIPGAGHLANLEEPGAFNAALREFMARVDRGPIAGE
jgi:pimeloyl-ACP methyl ester carboxylesterase